MAPNAEAALNETDAARTFDSRQSDDDLRRIFAPAGRSLLQLA